MAFGDNGCSCRKQILCNGKDNGWWFYLGMHNDDPFSGQLGVAEGLIFYDENFGVAGITGASQSYSRLYVTRDGGRTFEEMKLPMDLVSELPQIAIDCGFTVEDFDYLNMPEKRTTH